LQFVITGIANGAIYALIALGFTLIYNSRQIINFAQGEFVVIGGMAAYTYYATLHLPLWAAVILAVLSVTLLGVAFERLVILPLKNAAAISLIIATVGMSILLRTASMLIWGKEALSLPHFFGDKPVVFFGATILPQQLFIIALATVIVIAMQLFFSKTVTGKAMKAASINPEAASLMGINSSRMVMYSFAFAAGLGAIAGVAIAPLVMMSFGSGASLGIKGFSAAILGGLTNPLGAVLGGITLGVIESVGAGLISSAFKEAIALVVLLAVLLIKPSGLFGKLGTRRIK
jgi:branched-chain amino acid transport system permease protein